MSKYLVRYLFFWLPAIILSLFFQNDTKIVDILSWFFAFFMLFGWSVNTGMAAYRYPRSTLAALLTYTGFHILIIITLYSTDSRQGLGIVLRRFGGLLSFQPLRAMVEALREYDNLMHELIITGVLVVCCLIGYLVGLMQRKINPDLYRPRIRRT